MQLHQLEPSFSSTWKKTKQKKTLSREPCASSTRPERAETRFAQTVRTLLSGRVDDARRGTKGSLKTKG
jgi:hypothetical protein